MIKRYILHIEFHRGYRPHISFRRVPQPGDRVLDGGVMGTLKRCPTCTDGLLHSPDERPKKSAESERPPTMIMSFSGAPWVPVQNDHQDNCKHFGGPDPCPIDRPDFTSSGHENLGV